MRKITVIAVSGLGVVDSNPLFAIICDLARARGRGKGIGHGDGVARTDAGSIDFRAFRV